MASATETMQQRLERLLLKDEIEQFLYMEAELLDERKYSAWLDLIADDIHYWMPTRRNIKFGDEAHEYSDPELEISWMNEGKRTLAARVQQLNTGVHWCEEPVSRNRHTVSAVQILDVLGDEVKVRCRFNVYTNRLFSDVGWLVGKREDTLRRDLDTGWKIAKRTIILDQNVLISKAITTFL